MKIRSTAVICVAVTVSAYASLTQANNENAGNQRMSQNPDNPYWQAPNWSGPGQAAGNAQAVNQPHANRPPPPPRRMQPAYNNYNQAPPMPPARNYRPPQQGYNPAYAPPPSNGSYANRSNQAPPPPRGPYPDPNYGSNYGPNYGPGNSASAFNTPGYRNYRGNSWNNNKFWGRSGPSTWMNPSKGNMERGWDDMMNSPSRMGEMPGGWTAPEVSMPNPIDMGDQIQDNVKELPEQIRNMDVGNGTE